MNLPNQPFDATLTLDLPEATHAPNLLEQSIFIAMNDGSMADNIAALISGYGYRPTLFQSLDTLMESIQHNKPDAIIMDIGFTAGELEGAVVLERIQSILPYPIPVLFISPYDHLNARLTAARAFGQAYLTPPVEPSVILEHLDLITASAKAQPYKVLIVEDSTTQARFIENALKKAGMITCVIHDSLPLLSKLVDFQPELILMDMYLPQCTGLELARVIRQLDAYLSVPIVFLSSEQDLSQQLKALMLGGDDFLTKPITPEHLTLAVRSRANRARSLRGMMIRDSLTGLLNHAAILDALEIETVRAQREQAPLCFAMIDIDHFKNINDTYGHPVGDRVIKSLTRTLQQRLRKTDSIGRYGGEEFAIIFPHTDAEEAKYVLDGIREHFSTLKHESEEHCFQVNFSAGIVALSKQPAHLLPVFADKALYCAKEAGRNQVLIYREE